MKTPVELYYLMTHGEITRAEFMERLDEVERDLAERKERARMIRQDQIERLEREEEKRQRSWARSCEDAARSSREWDEAIARKRAEEAKRHEAEITHAQVPMQRVGGQWLIPLRPSRESMEREYERRLFG